MIPQVGRSGYIKLMGQEFRYKEGTYQRSEAPSFAQKMTIGDLKYSDLSPSITAFAVSSWHSGYGFRDYSSTSDLRNAPNAQYATEVPPVYFEGRNVDASEAGAVYLSALKTSETLTDSDGPVVWMGEIGGKLYAIAGTKVFERGAGWTLKKALPATPVKGAIGVFGTHVVIGYGATRTAQYTDDFVTLSDITISAVAAYVWAFTSDEAAAYIAGGTSVTSYNSVISSADGIAYAGTPVVCGSTFSKITSLAPSGGIAILFVGKETELGTIDYDGNYKKLVPFDDSKLATNGTNLTWWLGTGDENARGPLVLFFNRGYGLWNYRPQSNSTGSAENLTPWAAPYCRPVDQSGQITAICGTSRWLYFAVKNRAGDSFILRKDCRTGAVHTWLTLGANDCRWMSVSNLYGQPYLFVGKGNNLIHVKLPLYDDSPLDDGNCLFELTGELDLPTLDLMFPDESKVGFTLNICAERIVAGAQYIEVWVSLDGGSYLKIGTVDENVSKEIAFQSNALIKKADIRLKLVSVATDSTPVLRAVIFRGKLVPKLYTIWTATLFMPQGSTALPSEDLRNPKTLVASLWEARRRGLPVTFTDDWGTNYVVEIHQMLERRVFREVDRVQETEIDIALMEIKQGAGGTVYGDPLSIYGSNTTLWG